MTEPTRDPRLLSAARLSQLRATLEQSDPKDMTARWSDGAMLNVLDHIVAVEVLNAEVARAAAELADWCERNDQAIDRRAILKDRLESLARCRQTGEPPVLWVFMRRCDELEAKLAAQDQSHAALVANLAMLVRRLCRRVEFHAKGEHDQTAKQAFDFLQRSGLAGGPLREDERQAIMAHATDFVKFAAKAVEREQAVQELMEAAKVIVQGADTFPQYLDRVAAVEEALAALAKPPGDEICG